MFKSMITSLWSYHIVDPESSEGLGMVRDESEHCWTLLGDDAEVLVDAIVESEHLARLGSIIYL